MHAGRPDMAERTLARFAPWAEIARAAWALPVMADCRALAATADAADAYFDAAIASVDRAGPLDRARIHLHYGEYLRRDRRRSTRVCTCAPPSTASSGSARRPGPSARCASFAPPARRPASATSSPLAELTPQEIQVARLVGAGATHEAVASQLFVSPKTVEYHLRKVFAKLGISSRMELVGLELGEAAGAAA